MVAKDKKEEKEKNEEWFLLSHEHCNKSGRKDHSVLADLEGSILVSRDSFAYFMLLAVEAGSFLRGLALLFIYPLFLFLQRLVSESVATQLLIFVSVAGVPFQDIQKVARTVLPRFYAADVCADSWEIFNAFGRRRVVVTTIPTVMVDPFVREYLGGDEVVGTELEVDEATGKATGFVTSRGLLVGREKKKMALESEFGKEESPEVGLWKVDSGHYFLDLCKENYVVRMESAATRASPDQLNATAIFHDGRFVNRPDPIPALLVFLWMPIGCLLSLLRIALFLSLPPRIGRLFLHFSGVRVVVRGDPPPPATPDTTSRLLVLNHRNNLDPIFVCLALGRRLPCVTYRLNRLFQFLSPIATVALSRERDSDASRISSLLKVGDLIMCPEGTTSREPYLLRFSALFAELTNVIVPVAIKTGQTMFHGTTFHGSKIMDPFFFFMNPLPTYEVTFLETLHEKHTCSGGKSRYDVANHVQKMLGEKLGFKCTNLARKDKYMKLGGGSQVLSTLPHGDGDGDGDLAWKKH